VGYGKAPGFALFGRAANRPCVKKSCHQEMIAVQYSTIIILHKGVGMYWKSGLALLFTIALCSGGERWYPIRFEYSPGSLSAVGVSSGMWWSLHENGIPVDAYGPTAGLMAYRSGNDLFPGVQFGLEANYWYVCARTVCGICKGRNNSTIALINPQAGVTWYSIANLYAGYSKVLAAPGGVAADEVNVSFCLNLPSYFFKAKRMR
jgi:hypothetical protein